jgi:hypothetical protein
LDRKVAILQQYARLGLQPTNSGVLTDTSQALGAMTAAATQTLIVEATAIVSSLAHDHLSGSSEESSPQGDALGPVDQSSAHTEVWVDVSVRDIDLSDTWVHGKDDFHKVSYDEVVDGFRLLNQAVRPAVDRGADGDYFSKLDEQAGRPYQQGYRRVYDAFYGQSAIRLEFVDGVYRVINGFHRLYVAKQLGLSTVPAIVASVSHEQR